jgi:hypothetical protein
MRRQVTRQLFTKHALDRRQALVKMTPMNSKTRVLRRYPNAKLVKLTGEKTLYSVRDGATVLCDSAKSPTDAWRRAALALDYPYSDATTRWRDTDERS